MEYLEIYRKQHPDLFNRLPLPKDLAEKYGLTSTEDVMPLSAYLKRHASLRIEEVHEMEERIACTITASPDKPLIEPKILELSNPEPASDVSNTVSNAAPVPESMTAPESGGQ